MASRAPFPVFYPSFLPSGFELVRVEESVLLTDATLDGELAEISLYRLAFSDGIERFEVYQNEPTALTDTMGTVVPGGPPSARLHVLSSDFLSIRHWSVAVGRSEIAIEGRVSTQRFSAILHGLQRIN